MSEVRKCYYDYKQMNVNVWNKLLRRNFIIENNILFGDVVLFEDWLWTFCLLKHIKKACFVSAITYHYKERPGSVTTGSYVRLRMENYGVVFKKILSNLTSGHEKEEFNYYAQWVSRIYLRNLRNEHGFEEILKQYMEKSKLYGRCHVRLMLLAAHCTGKFRYGWFAVETLRCVIYPRQFRNNIKRF